MTNPQTRNIFAVSTHGDKMSGRYSDDNRYIDYQPGTLNLILTVPHGGHLKPKSIPNRDYGSFVGGRIRFRHCYQKQLDIPVKVKADLRTVDLAVLLSQKLELITGRKPHLVINRLHRIKLDCNCNVEEAAFGVKEASDAWHEFHSCIQAAKSIIGCCGGLLLDIHGHRHPEEWVELGYGISGSELNAKTFLPENTTLRHLCKRLQRTIDFRELITGPRSLGGLISSLGGYSVVPSPRQTCPDGGKYFSGGYNVLHHSSVNGGVIDAIQIESSASCRESINLITYSDVLASAIASFLQYYNM